MAKNEAKIKFTAETKAFNASIQKANNEMQELRAELRLNETQMKSTGATVESLEQRHKILSNQLKTSEDKTEALTQKVNKAVEIFGENSTEVSKLKTQLLNAQTAEEKLRQAVEQCGNVLKEQKEEVDRVETATEKLTIVIDEQQTELNRLKAEYKDVILQYGKTSDEAQDLARQIDKLSGDLAKSKKEMENAEQAAEELDRSLEEAGGGAKEASEGFTVLKGAMADLVADGIEKFTGGLADITKDAFTTANDIGKATNTFIAKTGESVESSERFEAIMTDIYNGNYGESFEDIADSMATVKTSFKDLNDDELKNITTDALVLRDTFDMDVNESIRAANSLMDQYGITADEAFSLIAQGVQNGLNQNGDLLDVVNEYSVQFKNAGYSAEDMFNMLANGVERGTWSVDELGNAVKEFNIRMSDGSAKDAVEALGFSWDEVSKSWSKGGDDAKEVFNILFNELEGLENTTEGYGIGVGLLGTMYEDLGQDAVLALSKTEGEISKTKDALEEINSVKYDDLGSAFEGIKRNLQTSVAEPIKEEVMPVVNEFIEETDWQSVGQTVGETFGGIVEGAVAIGQATATATSWMVEHKGAVIVVAAAIGILTGAIGLYNAVQAIKTAMDAIQVTTIWALVSAHIAQAAAAMSAIAPYVLIVAAIAAVIAIIVLCVKHWDEIVEACKRCWERVKETLATWGEWIKLNVIEPTKQFFSGLWNHIKSATTTAFNAVKLTTANVWNGVKTVITNIVNAVKSKVTSVWNGIKTTTSSVFNSVKSTVSGIFGSIKSKISSAMDSAKNAVKSAIDRIKSYFNFSWSLPKLKLPHISISGSFSLNPPRVPKFGIEWYKNGGIFKKPTIFNTPYGFKGVGEAGAEAVLPIDRLEGYISNAIERTMQVADMQYLVNAIDNLANRPVNISINDRQFMQATASAGDSVNGLRTSFKTRGLVLE